MTSDVSWNVAVGSGDYLMTLSYHILASEYLCFMHTVTSGLAKLSTTLERVLGLGYLMERAASICGVP
jgi:hypothetical protein